jgi:hypothetical protein
VGPTRPYRLSAAKARIGPGTTRDPSFVSPSFVRTIRQTTGLTRPTLYDYINRVRPLNVLGSLKSDEVYSLVESRLWRNEIIANTAVMNA